MVSKKLDNFEPSQELKAYWQMLQFVHGLATVKQSEKSEIVTLKPEIMERMETLTREVIKVLEKQPDLTEIFLPQEFTLQNRKLESHLNS